MGECASSNTRGRATLAAHNNGPPPNLETQLCIVRQAPLLGVRVCGDVVYGVCCRHNLVGLAVWDLNGKLLLKRHDNLHGVQAVQAQVLLKVRSRRHLCTRQPQLSTPCNNSNIGSEPQFPCCPGPGLFEAAPEPSLACQAARPSSHLPCTLVSTTSGAPA